MHIQKRIAKQLAVVCTASFLALTGVACDDDDDDDVKIDARAVDATPVDATKVDAVPIDAGIDAMPKPKPTHSGTISVTELAVFGATAPPVFGPAIGIDFGSLAANTVTDQFGNPDAVAAGCSGFLLDVAKKEVPYTPSGDEGAVTITGTTLPIPPCGFDATSMRYGCPGAPAKLVETDMIVDPTPTEADGAYSLVLATPFAAAADVVGRYLVIQGTAVTGQNGLFPVFGYDATTKAVTYINTNPAATVGAMGQTAFIMPVAAAGPIPGGADFLPDDPTDKTKITVAFTPKEGGHFTAFTATAEVDPTGKFTLADTNLVTIPVALADDDTTTKHTVACADGSCSDGLAAVIVITTTDADVTGLGATDMPAATKSIASIKCIGDVSLTDKKVTISNQALHFLKKSGATRIRATFLRFPFPTEPKTEGINKMKVVAGHGIIGFGPVK
jgi:hypothetical protein